MGQIVWYFDKPTIGYCPECDCLATWDNVHSFHCPKDISHPLSEFEWVEASEPPE